MTIRLVLFDFDGTLADSGPWMRQIINEVARRYRFRTIAEHEMDELRGKDTRAILSDLGVPLWKLPFIARHMRALVARDSERIQPFPGIVELLEQLAAQGLAIAVVSSNSEANVRRILGAESARRVRYYACGAGLFGKRRKFREVLRRSGIPAHEAFAVGDEVRDIQAASAEHIASGAVSWGFATPELLRAHQPSVLFDSVSELSRYLLSAGPRLAPEAAVY